MNNEQTNPIVSCLSSILLVGIGFWLYNFVTNTDSSSNSNAYSTYSSVSYTPTSTQTSTSTPVSTEVVITTAKAIGEDFKANSISAEEKYKGKIIQLSGAIGAIDKGIFGDPYIMLDDTIFGAQCYFAKDQASLLSSLKSGQKVTVKGEFDQYFVNTNLKNCSVVN